MEELQYPEPQTDVAGAIPATENGNTTKRQRRPSVRLGEIGDQPAAVATLFQESLRRPKSWRPCKDQTPSGGKSSKIRQLAKLNAGSVVQEETLGVLAEEEDRDSKLKRAPKKPRSNWIPKIGEEGEEVGIDERGEELGLGGSQLRRSVNGSSRVRVGEGGVELEEDEADLDGPLLRNAEGDNGVKNWLNGLGLVRYWPVFEIHEVDEEVLPLLTLEDLKDMGVNAVGSRRKMFGAIQKLQKGFS